MRSTKQTKTTKVTVSFTLTTEFPESVIGNMELPAQPTFKDAEHCPIYSAMLDLPLYGWYQVTDFQIVTECGMSVNGVVKLAP